MDLPEDDDELVLAGELDARTAALQATVASVAAQPCGVCGARLCGHGALLNVVLGYRNAPRCAQCLGTEMREQSAALAERALQWILRRECFLHVWRSASAAEGGPGLDRPPCLFTGDRPPVAGHVAPATPATSAVATSCSSCGPSCASSNPARCCT